jgi:hypothetical protein
MCRGSLFFVRTVDVVGNASPTLAFLRRIGLRVNVMIGENILTNYGYIGPGVILLEN